MKNLIILSYGREIEYKRAILAILSFWAWYSGKRSEVRTIIYTDNPQAFAPYLADLQVEYQLLTPAKIQLLKGEHNYLHRLKAVIIEEFFANHPSDDLLFVDSDTFFISDPHQLLQSFSVGKSYMHLLEYSFEDCVKRYASYNKEELPLSFIRLIESRTFEVQNKEERFNRQQYIWNSGVLGLTKETSALMQDVLYLIDEFYSNTSWIISEQLAFSLILQTKTELLPSDKYVFHYWGQRQKVLVDSMLTKILTSDFISLGLADKLNFFKEFTIKKQEVIRIDKIKEHSINAFSTNRILSGFKHALNAAVQSPLDVQFMKELFLVFRRKINFKH